LKKQLVRPRGVASDHSISIRNMGLDSSNDQAFQRGRDLLRHQVCRQDTFSLVALERYSANDDIGDTRQEDYVKINFWLSGKHTTVLDGFGQFEHDGPEVFITSGPHDMIKTDILNRDTHVACVALCLLPQFFPTQMGLPIDQLPPRLSAVMSGAGDSYGLRQFPLTPDLAAATRAILSAPAAVRRQRSYAQAKAIELMCLLIHHMESVTRSTGALRRALARYEGRLRDAHELLSQHYAEQLTLERVSRTVGVNRMALSTGFRELFGITVHDYLQRVRMQRAYELLQGQDSPSIKQVAEAVGYRHASNFSTAFHAYFGFAPLKLRERRR
jgi:AraC-like DNA-binding protein